MNNKPLTKKTLEGYGFSTVFFDASEKKWKIGRYYETNFGSVQHSIIETKSGLLCFTFKGKKICLDLNRFLWAWFFEDLGSSDAIVHINRKRDDYRIENLKKVTVKEAISWDLMDRSEIMSEVQSQEQLLDRLGIGKTKPVRRKKYPKKRKRAKQ